MPKLRNHPRVSLSKQQLILRHAAQVFCEKGYEGASIRDISRSSGISLAGMYYYIKSKQELLECTMHELAAGFLGEISLRVSAAKSPIDKVRAVIDANFAPSQCTPEAVSAWLWFWGRVPTNEAFAAIELAADTHIIGELKRALQEIVPREDVDDVAEGVMALMYGFWLRFALDPKKIDVETARRITQDAVVSKLIVYGQNSGAAISANSRAD